MFEEEGHENVSLEEAEAVALPGGADISPELYGAPPHPRTHAYMQRDNEEIELVRHCMNYGIPIMGICRGAQLLCAMAGGSMYQHVNNHGGLSLHTIVDTRTSQMRVVNSLHHQMMIPPSTADVLAVASEATVREYVNDRAEVISEIPKRGEDIEAVWFPTLLGLGVQWHPEMATQDDDSRRYFFELVDEFILPVVEKGETVCAA
jgi:gamma-glutamyl-gamma-aminobutyrate hydrolase PuuD